MIAKRMWLPILVIGSFMACTAVPQGDGDDDDDDGEGGSDDDGPPKTSTGTGGKFTAANGGPTGGSPTGGSPTGGSPTGGSPTGGSPTGGSPAGGGECDTGDCDSCVNCASNGVCAQVVGACNNEPECAPAYECINACQDDACFENCQAQYPQGFDAVFNVLSCFYCEGCYQTCDGASVCG